MLAREKIKDIYALKRYMLYFGNEYKIKFPCKNLSKWMLLGKKEHLD